MPRVARPDNHREGLHESHVRDGKRKEKKRKEKKRKEKKRKEKKRKEKGQELTENSASGRRREERSRIPSSPEQHWLVVRREQLTFCPKGATYSTRRGLMDGQVEMNSSRCAAFSPAWVRILVLSAELPTPLQSLLIRLRCARQS